MHAMQNSQDDLEWREDRADRERQLSHSHVFDAKDCTFPHAMFLSENDVLI